MIGFGLSIRNLFSSKKKPLVNILVRTSDRPKYFRSCYESIKGQTYKSVRIIVSYDNESTYDYLKKYKDILKVRVYPLISDNYPPPEIERDDYRKFPPELYMNDLMQHVKSGFIVYLDDDDCYVKENSLETIVKNITSEDDLLFWRVKFPEGKIIPEIGYFGNPPVFCHVSTIGFCFHSKYIPFAQWDGWRGSDYLVASKLYKVIPNKIYINDILTGLQRTEGFGGWGKRDDKKD